MKEKEVKGDCSNCRHSTQVAPYKVFLKCKLDGKLYDQPFVCDKWESLIGQVIGGGK